MWIGGFLSTTPSCSDSGLSFLLREFLILHFLLASPQSFENRFIVAVRPWSQLMRYAMNVFPIEAEEWLFYSRAVVCEVYFHCK
jgi:hypothetical protein